MAASSMAAGPVGHFVLGPVGRLARPAYALPLEKLGLPVSALVVGSMVPDVPLFIAGLVQSFGVTRAYGHTHSLLGLVSADLGLGGLIGLTIIAVVIARALWRTEPHARVRRLPQVARLVWVVPALVVLASAALMLVRLGAGVPIKKLAFRTVTAGGVVCLLSMVVVALVWHAGLARSRGSGPTGGQPD